MRCLPGATIDQHVVQVPGAHGRPKVAGACRNSLLGVSAAHRQQRAGDAHHASHAAQVRGYYLGCVHNAAVLYQVAMQGHIFHVLSLETTATLGTPACVSHAGFITKSYFRSTPAAKRMFFSDDIPDADMDR
jgi:hypothetical protein